MADPIADYGRARQAVLDAQQADNKEALNQAHADLAAAIVPIKAKVDQAWNANVAAMRTAQVAVRAAMDERIRVETEIGEAARARNPAFPVVTEDEKARAQAAVDVWLAAKDTLEDMAVRVKAGVSAEQLEALG